MTGVVHRSRIQLIIDKASNENDAFKALTFTDKEYKQFLLNAYTSINVSYCDQIMEVLYDIITHLENKTPFPVKPYKIHPHQIYYTECNRRHNRKSQIKSRYKTYEIMDSFKMLAYRKTNDRFSLFGRKRKELRFFHTLEEYIYIYNTLAELEDTTLLGFKEIESKLKLTETGACTRVTLTYLDKKHSAKKYGGSPALKFIEYLFQEGNQNRLVTHEEIKKHVLQKRSIYRPQKYIDAMTNFPKEIINDHIQITDEGVMFKPNILLDTVKHKLDADILRKNSKSPGIVGSWNSHPMSSGNL